MATCRGLPFGLLILDFSLAAMVAACSNYRFVWAMEANHPHVRAMVMTPTDIPQQRSELGLGRNFLAVFDVAPGPSFGKLVATLPVGDALPT